MPFPPGGTIATEVVARSAKVAARFQADGVEVREANIKVTD